MFYSVVSSSGRANLVPRSLAYFQQHERKALDGNFAHTSNDVQLIVS